MSMSGEGAPDNGFYDTPSRVESKFSSESFDSESTCRQCLKSVNCTAKGKGDLKKRRITYSPDVDEYTKKVSNFAATRSRSSHSAVSDGSVYGRRSQHRELSPMTKTLDWIAMCFWKCSPGCQKLPRKK